MQPQTLPDRWGLACRPALAFAGQLSVHRAAEPAPARGAAGSRADTPRQPPLPKQPHCREQIPFGEESTFGEATSFNPGLPSPNSTTVEGRIADVEKREGRATGTGKTAGQGLCCCGETEARSFGRDGHQGLWGCADQTNTCICRLPLGSDLPAFLMTSRSPGLQGCLKLGLEPCPSSHGPRPRAWPHSDREA